MATATVCLPQSAFKGVVGVHYAASTEDLGASLQVYNELPDDSDQREVPYDMLKALASIFIRHNAYKHYGLHLVHGHAKAADGTVILGESFEEDGKNICWTRPVQTNNLNSPYHGHIYKLVGDDFIPYEYRKGSLDSGFLAVSKDFFRELAEFLKARGLDDLLGLEVLDRAEDPHCGEFVLGYQGTVLVENKDIANGHARRKTQFLFTPAQDPDPVQPGTTHSETTYETPGFHHQDFNQYGSAKDADARISFHTRARTDLGD
ncbi:hypothetical protein GGR57DRAFT_505306 [Xylariaceae sp. FL1272]|nr:hypothetical protein GGR57DRAFT_505306 [Xylariaceae sp. FL1272]